MAPVQDVRYEPTYATWGPLAVPDDHLFVLGDNRGNAWDSRYWGFVPLEDLVGQPRRIYFSWHPDSGTVRWDRIGLELR